MRHSPIDRSPKAARSRSGRGERTMRRGEVGPSQRQLRAGELVRHSLAAILLEADLQDPALKGVSVTVTEVRLSPDLRHATCFVEPLGAGVGVVEAKAVVDGLNRTSKYLRGRLGKMVDLKFTPDLRFVHDDSFNEASYINALFARPEVARDLSPDPAASEDSEAPDPSASEGSGDAMSPDRGEA